MKKNGRKFEILNAIKIEKEILLFLLDNNIEKVSLEDKDGDMQLNRACKRTKKEFASSIKWESAIIHNKNFYKGKFIRVILLLLK